uniref:protein fuzzy homolog n=1 Tax=Styela clava TaxID=7725 RepID=UPI0019395A6F|nr:protein fuzzy homolog [Styela clava]
MAEHIICVTATGGLPLFTRSKQGSPPLSFPVMASLNGVHLFAQNRDVTLVSTLTTDHKIVWKMYQDSIVLIALVPNQKSKKDTDRIDKKKESSEIREATISDAHLLRILDNVFHSLVLLTGLDELCNHNNIERLKRDLRASYKLIDSFLKKGPDSGDSHLFGDFTQCVDMVLCNEAPMLQEHLNAFVEAADSTYGCLVAGGRVVCATEKWWMLTGLELALLGRLISVLSPNATSCDIPVYLPHSSPNIPHRLLLFTLISAGATRGLGEGGVRACVLCGPEPSLMEVQNRLVQRFWYPGVDTLQKCVQSCMTGFPPNLTNQMPAGLLAFLLINRESCQCVPSLTPLIKPDGTVDKKLAPTDDVMIKQDEIPQALRDFYSEVVGTTFPLPETVETDSEKLDLSRKLAPPNRIYAKAHYTCLDSHKAFALRRGPHQLFCLYHPSNVPTFALQGLTENVLNLLVKEGLV